MSSTLFKVNVTPSSVTPCYNPDSSNNYKSVTLQRFCLSAITPTKKVYSLLYKHSVFLGQSQYTYDFSYDFLFILCLQYASRMIDSVPCS